MIERSLDDIIAVLPDARRKHVEARGEESRDEAENLSELRRVAGKAQIEIAAALNVKQPSVSKIEKHADMYLSTLRSYVEAIGGELELIVRRPSHAPLRLERLGDVTRSAESTDARRAQRRARTKTAA